MGVINWNKFLLLLLSLERPKTSKTASKTNLVKKNTRRQDNAIYTF